jgi:hypothetical protein
MSYEYVSNRLSPVFCNLIKPKRLVLITDVIDVSM